MATLTVTIQEELVLNGQNVGCTNIANYTVSEVYHRIVTITNTEKSILLFGAAVEGGTIKDAQLDYLRITNLDSSATVDLRIRNASEEFMVRVNAGSSFILTEDKLDADATGSDEVISLAQIDSIKAVSSTSTSSIEIYAGSS
jgi:hypothetical protein|tara:strand:+ start:606 stop:1034 length:429 start_codon:yes stop_codon:yes gene_type:complete